jgi:DNA-binding NarL/FixJ family response regulator
LQGIRAVSKGKAAFSPPLGRRMLKRWHNRNPQSQSAAGPELSSRQTEVLQLIAEGYSTHQIADLLSLSSKTVEKHRQALMDRLDIHKIATLICYAVSRGIVEARPCVRMAPTGEQKLTSVTS